MKSINFSIIVALFLSVCAGCDAPVTTPTPTDIPRLAMVISPPMNDWEGSFAEYLVKAKGAGVEMGYWYFEWGELESSNGNYTFETFDSVVIHFRNNDVNMAAAVNIIDVFTGELADFPDDIVFTSFDDPVFVDRFGDFLIAFLGRYNDVMEYLYLTNEIDTYLAQHPDELDDYCAMLDTVIPRLNAAYPGVKIGTVSTFHSAYLNDYLYIPVELAKHVNVMGFSLYYINAGCTGFAGQPSDIREWLPLIAATAGDTPIAIVETSWTANPDYGGGELIQSDYVTELFAFQDYFGDKLEYICWFAECDLIASAFHGMHLFEQLGLISYEGVERPSWRKWNELAAGAN